MAAEVPAVGWWRWCTALFFVIVSIASGRWIFGPDRWVAIAGNLPMHLITYGWEDVPVWAFFILLVFNWACYAALGAFIGGLIGRLLHGRPPETPAGDGTGAGPGF